MNKNSLTNVGAGLVASGVVAGIVACWLSGGSVLRMIVTAGILCLVGLFTLMIAYLP